MMDLPFQDGLKIFLDLPSGHLDHDPQRQTIPFFDIGHIRTDDLHLAVFDGVHISHLDQLGGLGLAAAHLQIEVFLANPLPFKGRTVGQGDIDIG